MEIDKIIMQRLNSIEKDLKQAIELLQDVYAQKNLVDYLLQLKEEEKKS